MRLSHVGRRQFAAHRSVSVALAVVVAVVALVVTAWPRLVAATNADQVAYELADSSAQQRDVVAVGSTPPDLGPADPAGSTDLPPDVEAQWGAFEQGLEQVRADQPEPLRSTLGAPSYTVEDDTRELTPVPGNNVRHPNGAIKVDPHLGEHVSLVDGAWPGPVQDPPTVDVGQTILDEHGVARTVGPQVVDVVTSDEAARVLGWSVGDTITMDPLTSVRLTGTFVADDPDDPYWEQNPYSATPYVDEDLNLGTSVRTALYVDPATFDRVQLLSPTTRVWYPTSGDALAAGDVAPLLAQLRGFTAVPHEVVPGGEFVLSPSSELTTVLGRLLGQQRASSAILTVLAVGPLGVTVAVLLLGARLVVARRRASLALLRARGASGPQLRGLMAGEGLALGLPAAALGAVAAVLVVAAPQGATTPASFVPALLVALAPAALFALATSPSGLRESRADLGGRPGRLATVAGLLVIAAAAVSVVLLLQRGVLVAAEADGATDAGVDPLLAAAPLLLAVATALIVVRLAPWPVRGLERVLRRRRDLVPFLGAARAVRDPAGGVVPALALVVGVSVALASGVLATTVRDGVTDLAWEQAGADLRVSGPIVDDDALASLEQVDGVGAVATVADGGSALLRQGGVGERVQVVAVDARALAALDAETPGADPMPAGLGTDPGDRTLPVVVSRATDVDPGTPDLTLVAEQTADADVLAVTDAAPLAGVAGSFVVVDRALATDALGLTTHPRLALVALDDGADPDAVRAAVRRVLPTAVVTSPDEIAAQTLESPLSRGLDAAFVAAVVLSGLLCAAAVVLTLMIGGPARERLVAVLRTLGLDRRRTRGLVAWEIGPWALVSLVVGALLGVAIPAIVRAAVDLTPVTGGESQPALAVDPLLLGAGVLGFVVVVLVAVLVASGLSRRRGVAQALRIGEER